MTWSRVKRSVLVPFDLAEPNLEAIDAAGSFVENLEHVIVLHVIEDVPPLATGSETRNRELVTARDRIADRIQTLLRENGYPQSSVWVRKGPVANVIVDTAKAESTELIVMPSHGRKGVDRLLLGSVTERVVRFSPCPVLVLRAPNER